MVSNHKKHFIWKTYLLENASHYLLCLGEDFWKCLHVSQAIYTGIRMNN